MSRRRHALSRCVCAISLGEFPEDIERGSRRALPGELADPRQASPYQIAAEFRLRGQPKDRLRQLLWAVWIEEHRSPTGHLGDGARICANHWAAACHGFELSETERLVQRGVHEAVGETVQHRQIVVRNVM